MTTIASRVGNYFLENEVTTWLALANGDDGAPAGYTGAGARTVQVTGVFGSGGSVSVEGSLDAVNWFTLNDPLGAPLVFTAAGMGSIAEHVLYVRPLVTAGDVTTLLTVMLAVRKGYRG